MSPPAIVPFFKTRRFKKVPHTRADCPTLTYLAQTPNPSTSGKVAQEDNRSRLQINSYLRKYDLISVEALTDKLRASRPAGVALHFLSKNLL